MVNVLPVPALASSTVVPTGRGPQTSKTTGSAARVRTAVIGASSRTSCWSSQALRGEEGAPQAQGEVAEAGGFAAAGARQHLGARLLPEHPRVRGLVALGEPPLAPGA